MTTLDCDRVCEVRFEAAILVPKLGKLLEFFASPGIAALLSSPIGRPGSVMTARTPVWHHDEVLAAGSQPPDHRVLPLPS